MTIKQQGGVFGRNPSFNDLEANSADVRGLLKVSNEHNENFIELSSTTTDDEAFVKLASTDLVIDHDPTGARSSSDIALNSDGVEVLRIKNGDSGGDLQPRGNVVLAEGQGIDFSATSGTGTSELFDDYEEGVFTPVPADASSGGNTGTTASNVGIYTKIGNTVYVQLGMLNINTSGLTAGNDFWIQGLPFTAGNTSLTSYATGACVPSGNISYTGQVVAGVTDNKSAIRLIETASGSNLDYVLVSELTNGASDIWVSLVYRTS
jgi:hypothetical protein